MTGAFELYGSDIVFTLLIVTSSTVMIAGLSGAMAATSFSARIPRPSLC